MPIDTSSIQSFTDTELLLLYRNCLAQIAVNQAYSINGRQYTRADLAEVRDMIDWLEKRVNDASGVGDTILVQFGEPQ